MLNFFRTTDRQATNLFIFDGDQTDNLFVEFLKGLKENPGKYQDLDVFYVKCVTVYRRPVKIPAEMLELAQDLASKVRFHFKLTSDVSSDGVINTLCQTNAGRNIWVFSGDKRLKSALDGKVKFMLMIPDQV